MAIQAGKGNKIVGSQKTDRGTDKQFKSRLNSKLIAKPNIPRALAQINVGPELDLAFDLPKALAVDGSNALLRGLSPFVLQVEPPLVFSNEPKSSGKSKATGLFDAAFTGNTNSGRNSNAANAFTTSGGGDANEMVTKNYPGPQTNKSGDGKVVTSDSGASGKLGHPQIADMNTAIDIHTQLAAALNSPPLVLLINPNNLTMQYSRLHQFSDRSRFGYIYQAWGEEQPRLSVTAKCGAFISGGRGVQNASKRDSASWQNLMSLFHLYRSNGYFYDTVGKSNAHLFVGGLSIHYDGWIYYGNMESFTWTHDESNELGGVEFQMEFVCSVMVDTSKQTQAVRPMKLSTPRSGSAPAGDTNQSVGADGNVRGAIFGSAPPSDRPTPGQQGFGDTDFVAGGLRLQLGSSAVAKGGGFSAPTDTVTPAVFASARPLPFRRE